MLQGKKRKTQKNPNLLAKKNKFQILLRKKCKYFGESEWCWHMEFKTPVSHTLLLITQTSTFRHLFSQLVERYNCSRERSSHFTMLVPRYYHCICFSLLVSTLGHLPPFQDPTVCLCTLIDIDFQRSWEDISNKKYFVSSSPMIDYYT